MLNRLASFVLLPLLLAASPALAAGLAEELTRELHSGAEAAASDSEAATLANLVQFYSNREMEPLWVTAQGATERASQLSAILAAADEDALDPDDYGAAAIDALLGAGREDLLAQLEVRLSLGLVKFVADLGQGRVTPQVADLELFVLRDEVDKAQVMAAVAHADDVEAFVGHYRPQTPRYDRLKTALARYRAIARSGGWASIPDGPTLKPGMTDPRVGPLRDRLGLWGDLAEQNDRALSGGDPDFYDDGLVEAVGTMQARHGLEADGAVGRQTLTALNAPVEERIEQMILNLERRRWMPDDLGRRYVFVNLADFTLKVVDEPKTVLDTRVVIGKTYHMTPVFSGKMTYVVINPYWHVPPSIAREELLPKIKQNVSYLADNKFTVFSDWSSNGKVVDPKKVDWTQYSGTKFPFKLRQSSGDGNALGRVKFMFPNHFNVYLHDTPAKSLFSKSQRDFSHGCIRVWNPPALADVILAKTPGWSPGRVEATIASGQRTIVTLSERLPVHISYLTAWVNKDGSVHFRKDIYKRDQLLADALLGPRAMRVTY